MTFLANHRDTQFEITHLHQGPNGLRVEVIERGVYGTAPPEMTLTDGSDPSHTEPDLSPEVVAAGVTFFTGLEAAYAKRYAALVSATKATDPSHVHGLVEKATKAKADAAAAQDALQSAEAAKAVAEMAHQALLLEHAELQAKVAAAKAQLAAAPAA